jgi:transcriptional regulator with GAF, ATPase, and Fis domain
MILAALQQTHGVQARAAKILRVSQRSLGYRIETLGIPVRTPDEAPSA